MDVLIGSFPKYSFPNMSTFLCPSAAGRHPQAIIVTDAQCAILEQIVRRQTRPQHQVRRARIILLAVAGKTNQHIAEWVEVPPEMISVWRGRSAAVQARLAAAEQTNDDLSTIILGSAVACPVIRHAINPTIAAVILLLSAHVQSACIASRIWHLKACENLLYTMSGHELLLSCWGKIILGNICTLAFLAVHTAPLWYLLVALVSVIMIPRPSRRIVGSSGLDSACWSDDENSLCTLALANVCLVKGAKFNEY